jgi:glycosyltransferase involved in cell wall biosynthesis
MVNSDSMRKVCFVNNYNYDKYLPFCLDSLVRQSVKFDVIYVVDDGSTDRSRSIITEYAKSFLEIVPLFKDNAGQLSCFNVVSDYITEDDLVWCIDSDDYYPPDYVELFLDEIGDSKSDFFFCESIKFSTDDMAPKTSYLEAEPVVDIGLSVQMGRLGTCWIGSPTSGLVTSGRLYKDVIPYPFESEWVIRADDIIVFASSVGGYSKTYIPSLCCGYRVHDANNFLGRDLNDSEYNNKRTKDFNTLFAWCSDKYGLGRKIIFTDLLNEYNSISSPEYRKYIKSVINISNFRLYKKILIEKICSVSNMIFNK